jgi:hypothetical protein
LAKGAKRLKLDGAKLLSCSDLWHSQRERCTRTSAPLQPKSRP